MDERPMELRFRERKAPVPGFHAQALGVIAFSLLGLGTFVALSAYQARARAHGAAPDQQPWSVSLVFGLAALTAAVNAGMIFAGRRPPVVMRFAPLVVVIGAWVLAVVR